jgi:hypothetical protein
MFLQRDEEDDDQEYLPDDNIKEARNNTQEIPMQEEKTSGRGRSSQTRHE